MKKIKFALPNCDKSLDLCNAMIGKRIRGYDFEPIRINGEPVADYPDSFVEGVVDRVELNEMGYWAFVVEVDSDCGDKANEDDNRVGFEYMVPVVCSHDWDGRLMVEV